MRWMIALTAALVVCGLASVPSAVAASDVRVTALDCESHPRRIRVENMGDAPQDLTGWQLQSDPAEGTPFDLGQVGTLGSGGKIYVFQGHLSPDANPSINFYRWGDNDDFFLRANDSSDYVRIVDSAGNTVMQKNCEGVSPTPSPEVTAAPDPPAQTVPPAPAVVAPGARP